MECVSCNAHNPDGTMYCIVCGTDLPKSNPSLGMAKPKLAVFHVEETVLDNSAGERIAKRKGLSGKRFGREVAANLEKAVSRIGVKDYINRLARDNYTIAFISSLDSSYQYRLQDRLRHLGFPIMTDTTGPLVLMGSSQDNIRSLARRYDITFAFGTSPAGTAKQMNVPGVYATVEDYIGDSKNPYIAPTETPAPYTLSGLRPEPTPAPYTLANPHEAGHFTPTDWWSVDNWDELPAWMEKVDYANTQHQMEKSGIKDMTIFEIEDALRLYEHEMKETTDEITQEEIAGNIKALVSELRRRKGGYMTNPPKPRRQKSKKTGKARRESAKKYFERLMGNKMMNKEFPDNSQRSAVALSYVEKEYGKRGVNSVTKSWGAMANPDRVQPRPTSDSTPRDRWGTPTSKPSRQPSALMQIRTDPKRKYRFEPAKLKFKRQEAPFGYPGSTPAASYSEAYNQAQDRPLFLPATRVWFEDSYDVNRIQGGTVDVYERVLHGAGQGRKIEPFKTLTKEEGFYRLIGRLVPVISFKDTPMTNPTTEGLPIYSGQPTGAKNLGMVSAVVQVGRGFMKDIGEGLQDFYRALIGGRQSMTEKRMMMAVAEMHRDLTKAVEQKGGNAIGNVRLDYEHPKQVGDITLIATADALKVPKKNPASSKKLKKAKDAYKKFHGGKKPDEVKTEKIDVGDVWYSLGECWTLGYMSPKENGNEFQKFIHEMNEESKDGNYPTLYATMPESGEPMLIIKGGSMKIGMRDGKAWLID